MNKQLTFHDLLMAKSPSLEQQIAFLKLAQGPSIVLRTDECRAMLKAIEANLNRLTRLKTGDECRLCGAIPADFVPESPR